MIQNFKFPHSDPEGNSILKQLTYHHGDPGLWETGQPCLRLLIWVSVYWSAGSWLVLSPPSWQVRGGTDKSATHTLSACTGPTFPTQEKWQKTVLSYSSPMTGGRLALLLGKLLTIFSFVNSARATSKATVLLSTSSINCSPSLLKACAFLARLSSLPEAKGRECLSVKCRIIK